MEKQMNEWMNNIIRNPEVKKVAAIKPIISMPNADDVPANQQQQSGKHSLKTGGNAITMGHGNVIKKSIHQECDGGPGRNVICQESDNTIGGNVNQILKNTSGKSENKLRAQNMKVGGKVVQKQDNVDGSSENTMDITKSAEFGEFEQSQTGKGKMVNKYDAGGKTTVHKTFAQETENTEKNSPSSQSNQAKFGDKTELGNFKQRAIGGKAVNEFEAGDINVHNNFEQIETEKEIFAAQSSEEPTKTTETKVDEELKTNETSDSDVDEHNDSETSEPANLVDDVQDKTNEEKENEVTLNGAVGEEYDVLHKIDTNDEYQVNFWKKTTVFAGFAIIVGYAIYHFNILQKYNIDFA